MIRRLALAAAFPPPLAHTPGASQLIWSFVSKTPLAPLPS
jgi:hypothetical protein